MYYSRDCLLLFYSSWVCIISMSWIHCREGSSSTAAVLSRVSECTSSDWKLQSTHRNTQLMTVFPHLHSRWKRQGEGGERERERERLMKTISCEVRKRMTAEEQWYNWGSNKKLASFSYMLHLPFSPLQQIHLLYYHQFNMLFFSSVFIFVLHKTHWPMNY